MIFIVPYSRVYCNRQNKKLFVLVPKARLAGVDTLIQQEHLGMRMDRKQQKADRKRSKYTALKRGRAKKFLDKADLVGVLNFFRF